MTNKLECQPVHGGTWSNYIDSAHNVELSRSELYRLASIADAAILREHGHIRCRETGHTWPTITAAARAMSLGTGNLSNHLNGHPSYQTVCGYTFERVLP